MTNYQLRITNFQFFFLLSLIGLSSCSEKLGDEEKLWNPYQKGEMIVLKSDLEHSDTIKITDTQLKIQPSHWPSSSSKEYEYLEVHTDVVEEFTCLLTISPDVNTSQINLMFNIPINRGKNDPFFANYRTKGKSLIVEGCPSQGVVINEDYSFKSISGKTTEKCYRLFNYDLKDYMDQKPEGDFSDFVQYVYWSKDKGLLGYQKFSGELFRVILRRK